MANIVPDITVVKGEDPISRLAINYAAVPMANTIGDGSDVEDCLTLMKGATELSLKGLNYKLYAGERRIDDIMISLAQMRNTDQNIVKTCLECLILLYTGYPDLLKEETVEWLLVLYRSSDETIRHLILKLLNEGCTAHEPNKQLLFAKPDFIEILRSIIDTRHEALLCPTLAIICNLSKDDDIRVEVSKAHERATNLAEDRICLLYDMTRDPSNPLELQVYLLKALSTLTVTNTLALEVFHHDETFSIVESVLVRNGTDQDIVASTMRFLVALGGNDDAKCAMKPLVPLIISTIDQHLGCPPVVQFAFLLISAVSLRNKENAMALIECNALEILLQGMKVHEKYLKILRNGCLALRNIASSSKHLKPFEELNVADYVNEVITKDKTNAVTDVAKGVLVALGAPVELQERWTGAKGDILSANEITSSSRQ